MLKKIITLSYLFSILFFVDRLVEYYIFNNPALKQGLDFFKFLTLKIQVNSNLALSLPANNLLIAIVSFLIILYLLFLIIKGIQIGQSYVWGLSLILAGAISNVIDRLVLGGVLDFINLAHFTSFNISDVYITLGAIMVALTLLPKKQTSIKL